MFSHFHRRYYIHSSCCPVKGFENFWYVFLPPVSWTLHNPSSCFPFLILECDCWVSFSYILGNIELKCWNKVLTFRTGTSCKCWYDRNAGGLETHSRVEGMYMWSPTESNLAAVVAVWWLFCLAHICLYLLEDSHFESCHSCKRFSRYAGIWIQPLVPQVLLGSAGRGNLACGRMHGGLQRIQRELCKYQFQANDRWHNLLMQSKVVIWKWESFRSVVINLI